MALLQGAVSGEWQTLFALAFGLYFATLVIEKTGAAITMTSQYPRALSRTRSGIVGMCAIMYIYVNYKTANSQTRFAQSTLITILMALMVGLHASVQSSPTNDDEVASAKFSYQTVCFVVATLFVGLTVVVWQALPTKPVPQHRAVLLTPVIAVLAYAIWAASIIAKSSGKMLDLNRSAFVSPMVLLALIVMLFFLLVGYKPAFNGDDLDKFKSLTWPLGLYGALLLCVYWQASSISNAQYATKNLMVEKLLGLQTYFRNTFPADFPKVEAALQTNATLLASLQSTACPTGAKLSTQLGAAADVIKGHGLNLDTFLSATNGTTDPSKGTSLAPINRGALFATLASAFVAILVWMMLRTPTFSTNLLSSLMFLAATALSGWCAYSYTQVCNFASLKNQIYCENNSIPPAQCDAPGSGLSDAPWMAATVEQVIYGNNTEPVLVDTGSDTPFDMFSGPLRHNLQDLYSMLDSPPGIQSTVMQYISTFNSLREIATQTNLWAWNTASASNMPAALGHSADGADPQITNKRSLTNYSIKDLLDILQDKDNFSKVLAPLGISSPYMPDAKNTAQPPNVYFTLYVPGATGVQIVPQTTTFGKNWQSLISSLLKLREQMRSFVPNADKVQDFTLTMNAYLLYQMFAVEGLHVGAVSGQDGVYIQKLQAAILQYFQSSLLNGTSAEVWATLTSPAAGWGLRTRESLRAIVTSSSNASQYRIALTSLLELASEAPHGTALTTADCVDLYLERVYNVVRVRYAYDMSKVGQDVLFADNDTILGIEVGSLCTAFCIGACVLFLLRTRLSFSNMLVDDYFKTSFLKKPPSSVFNPIFIAIVLVCILYGLYKAYDNYLFEGGLLQLATGGTQSFWAGKQTVAVLVQMVLLLISWIPMYYKVWSNRSQAVLITLIIMSMFYTPLIKFMGGMTLQQKADRLRQFNTWSMLFIFVIILLKVLTDPSDRTGSWFTWQNMLAAIAVAVSLVFTSLPAAMLELAPAKLTNDEYTGKLKQANNGALVGLAGYAGLLVVYLIVMRRMKLFSNGVSVGARAAAFNIVA